MKPLVPSNVDLRDFAFMPMDVHRLLTSDTWILSTGDERAAFMCLLLASWHQMPAGSLPGNERMLAHLAMASDWPSVREQALRGWELADDGRYYHKVVAEKAMEAWLEKLAQRLSSGSGNSSRWGIEFDAAAIENAMDEARCALTDINPSARALRKKRTAKKVDAKGNAGDVRPKRVAPGAQQESQNSSSGIPSGDNSDPIGTHHGNADGNPSSIPMLSQETETGTGTETGNKDQKHPLPPGGGNSAGAEPPVVVPRSKPPIPYEEIVTAYREKLPQLRQPKTLSPQRKRAIAKAWGLLPEKHRMVRVFHALFAECNEDPFLNGTGPYDLEKHPKWRPDFDYLISEKVVVRVYEAAMDRRERARAQSSGDGSRAAA